MAYEAPKITEAGRFSSTTLGNQLTAHNDDGTWYWPTTTPGSR